MKNKITILLATAAIAIAATACSFSTANMSSLKTFKDKDGKQEATSFKGGETIYANAEIANSMDKVTVKFNLMNDKGTAEPGASVSVDLPSSGTAKYSLAVPTGYKSGKYTLTADMINDKGEKKDSKSAAITIDGGSAPAAPAADDKKDASKDDHSTDKDDDN